MIWTFTYGIFFLAVPHHGSRHANWGQIIADIYLAAGQPNNSFLESVNARSTANEELNARFRPLYKAYKFYTWVESRHTGSWGMVSLRIIFHCIPFC